MLHDPEHRGLLENLFIEDLSAVDIESADSPEILDMVYQQVKLSTVLPEELQTKNLALLNKVSSLTGETTAEATQSLGAVAIDTDPVKEMLYKDNTADHLSENQETIDSDSLQRKRNKPFGIGNWTVAATVLITIAAGAYYSSQNYSKPDQKDSEEAFKKAAYILPGGNKAVLTLSDGSNIELDGAANGNIATESGTTIEKTADGRLSYSSFAANPPQPGSKPALNTITTPKGGQYQVILPDGTKVWLNASSSLRYPAVFTGQDRRVELTGEAYFEVAKNKEKPFFVKSQKQEVEVLGTHFNINAYNDEERVKTTLMEGHVKVKLNNGKTALLKPGEQSQVLDNIRVMPVEAGTAVEWKDGVFRFDDENIVSIMRQFSRWYDIDVVCQGDLSTACFVGQISKNNNLSQVLRLLTLTRSVRFKIEGKKVTVMPQYINASKTD